MNSDGSWPTPEEAEARVLVVQAKLEKWARDPHQRLDDIYNFVFDRAFLVHAYRRVSTRSGALSPGVDGVTVETVENEIGVIPFLDPIEKSLRSRTYRASPIRGERRPKRTGGERRIGISTFADRIVQRSTKQVLEPIVETAIGDLEFGYVRNRRPQDAVLAVANEAAALPWVARCDIADCFSSIEQSTLRKFLRNLLSDKRLLALVDESLRSAGRNGRGVAQGAVLSPLLVSLFLSQARVRLPARMPSEWVAPNKAGGEPGLLGRWQMVRYADDFVLMASDRTTAVLLLQELEETLFFLGMRLNPDKSVFTHINRGFDFLGFHIQGSGEGSEWKVSLSPSLRNVERLKETVLTIIGGNGHAPLERLIDEVQGVLRNRLAYFSIIDRMHLRPLRFFVRQGVRGWARAHGALAEHPSSSGYEWVIDLPRSLGGPIWLGIPAPS